ncbi:hypothetical protein EVAR_65996_1 [Eumeta japonica]|uniref:Uncharacterized protein n=1 Tax=Eumeta variegata TaxID=151549 RepID=A0A4C1ZNE5_EUMVA|nr:hypothetical protein EVAR_65996_1 [Eumeta japonica]
MKIKLCRLDGHRFVSGGRGRIVSGARAHAARPPGPRPDQDKNRPRWSNSEHLIMLLTLQRDAITSRSIPLYAILRASSNISFKIDFYLKLISEINFAFHGY